VQDVVPDLHVVEDFRGGEHRDTRQPGRRQQGREHRRPAADFQTPLDGDDSPDVPGVVLPQIGEDLLAEPVEFTAELLDVGDGEPRRAGRE
jgi:hypothetical protein